MRPVPVDRLVQRRLYRRTGERSVAAAILLHVLAIAALIVFVRSEPTPQNEAAPSDVALLFEGGLRQSSPLPPSERPSQAPLPSPTPGADAENSPSSSPPPGAPASAPIPQQPVVPIPPVPPSVVPPNLATASPETASRTAAAPAPAAPAEGIDTAAPPPDVAGTAPPPSTLASREPPATIAARPVPERPRPSRPQPRQYVRPPARPGPRFTPDGFPTTLFGSTDLAAPSSARHAANSAPPRPAQRVSAASDVHGGEALGADWLNEFSAYLERHKRYPEQAAENNDEGDTTVQIVVNRDGHVEGRDVDLVGRSGSQWLDLGLMAMFRGARLPAFPPGAPHDRETITVTMHYFLVR